MAKLLYTLVGDGDEANIVVFVTGHAPMTAHSSRPTFRAIADFCDDLREMGGDITEDEVADLVALFDTEAALDREFSRLSERISAEGGKLFLDGEELNGTVVDVIMRSMSQGLKDFTPLVNFIENMATNPNPGSVDQLYDWIKANGLTIDTDGQIVGYKGVAVEDDGNLVSINSGRAVVDGIERKGRIPNYIGAVVEMPRSEVQFDPSIGCHTGLHVGSYEYASGFAQGALLEVRVNPRDVVSVPTDCGAAKMRVCRYTVIGVIDQEYTQAVIGDDLEEFEYDNLWGDFEDDEYDDPFAW